MAFTGTPSPNCLSEPEARASACMLGRCSHDLADKVAEDGDAGRRQQECCPPQGMFDTGGGANAGSSEWQQGWAVPWGCDWPVSDDGTRHAMDCAKTPDPSKNNSSTATVSFRCMSGNRLAGNSGRGCDRSHRAGKAADRCDLTGRNHPRGYIREIQAS